MHNLKDILLKYPGFLFVTILLVFSFLYDYQSIISKPPQSIHAWRQSDCASLTLNYYQNGMRFFEPETHNLTSDGGTTGKCSPSEIPILYYCVALLYSAFGHHDIIFRLLNTLIFFFGLFYLFKLFRFVLKDIFWSIALTLLIFTAPVLVYYGNNYLSNSSALAFVFVGWYYFSRFLDEKKNRWFLLSVLAFFIGGACKVTALFSAFAICGIIVLELFKQVNFGQQQKLFGKTYFYLLPFLAAFFVIGSWILFAHWYNISHRCTYFSTTIFPIWDLDKTGINTVLQAISQRWLDNYFHPSTLIFLGICVLFLIFTFRKGNKPLQWIMIFISLELLAYSILQFWTFKEHDYYVIDMYILPVLIILATFDRLKTLAKPIFNSPYLKIAFALFVTINAWHAKQIIKERYESINNFQSQEDLYSIEPYLRSLGIQHDDRVISIPDYSHVSLYAMNQKGWTEYVDAQFNRGEKKYYNHDSAGIAESIENGAKYLIINGIKELYIKPYLQAFSRNLVGEYGNVLIFDLKNQTQNYTLPERKIRYTIRCDAETLNDQKDSYIIQDNVITAGNGNTQSQEEALEGKYSAKLDKNNPFGMTLRLNDIQKDDSFAISVWRKAQKDSRSGIVAASVGGGGLYLHGDKVIETEENGWEKLQLEFFIQQDLPNHELSIYLYNPGETPEWFDNLEAVHYASCF